MAKPDGRKSYPVRLGESFFTGENRRTNDGGRFLSAKCQYRTPNTHPNTHTTGSPAVYAVYCLSYAMN